MGKKGNFAGWFRPSLQKAKNGRVEAGAAHSAYFHQIVRMANVFRLGGVDCGEIRSASGPARNLRVMQVGFHDFSPSDKAISRVKIFDVTMCDSDWASVPKS